MRTWLISSSVLLLVTLAFNGMDSSYGVNALANTLPISDRLVLQERDEEPAYPDFDSGEQDRWPTLEELGLSKRSEEQDRWPTLEELGLSKRSEEQDRWPTLQELGLSKRLLSHKRDEENFGGSEGRMAYGKRPVTENRPLSVQTGPEVNKDHIVSSLYKLLSSKPRPAPQRRIMDNLKDIYAAELVKRHRLPRSPDDATINVEATEGEQVSEQVVQETSSNGQIKE